MARNVHYDYHLTKHNVSLRDLVYSFKILRALPALTNKLIMHPMPTDQTQNLA